METRRIIVANQQRLLREMMKRVIEKTPGFQVVGEGLEMAKLPAAIERTNAQWVIVSLRPEGELPQIVDDLLAVQPTLRVLALAPDGSQVKVKALKPREENLSNMNLNKLIAMLRSESSWEPEVQIEIEKPDTVLELKEEVQHA